MAPLFHVGAPERDRVVEMKHKELNSTSVRVKDPFHLLARILLQCRSATALTTSLKLSSDSVVSRAW